MGTYYLYVNLDKQEYLDPEDFDSGIKFSEVSASRAVGQALARLLKSKGHWCGDRIALVGDDQGLIVSDESLNREIQRHQFDGLYQLARYVWTSVTPTDLEELENNPNTSLGQTRNCEKTPGANGRGFWRNSGSSPCPR